MIKTMASSLVLRRSLLLAAGLLVACGDDTARTSEAGECSAGLLPGDLVISEIMINPAGADEGKEWFEIYNPGSEEVDLSGVVLRFRKADGSGEKLHQVQGAVIGAGEYLVLGDADPEALPAHVDYSYGSDFGQGFVSSAGEVALGCGSAVIDVVTYVYEDSAPEDVSYTYDGTRTPDAQGNDDLSAWCDATSEYEPEVFGTPGAPNDACFSEQPTTCNDGGTAREVRPPSPGDLVITEYMPNPAAVEDELGEWFEVYVGADIDLNGLALTKFGDEEPTDIIGSTDCLAASAGSYLVFARSADSAVNGGLPPVDHLFTMSLSNTSENGTGLSIGWGGQFLDTVTWNDSGTGASSQLDPGILDPTANDDEGAFCESADPYGDGDLGSPGEANPPCPIDAPEGQCVEDGTLRDVRAPSAGDLWITEFMANPAAVGDPEGEWFEIYANAEFDLNALEFGRDAEVEESVDEGACLTVSAGEWILFGKNAESATNGGLPAVAYEIDLSLINSNGRLFVGTGGTELDAVSWSSTEAGASRALDPSITGPDGNDDEAVWCDGTEPYGDGDLGTPSAENLACGGTPPGTCDDGGTVRDVVSPGMGQLIITEWMPDPAAVGDTAGEWFEVLVTADVDLNGLQFGNDADDPDNTLPNTGECLSVSAGTRIVLARNADMATNGGVDAFAEGSFTLGNGNGTLFVGLGGETFDEVTWADSTAGSSTSVSPGSEDPASNDDALNHCTSNTPFGDGDNGTPGAENACG